MTHPSVTRAAKRIWNDADTFDLPTDEGVPALAEIIERETRHSELVKKLESLTPGGSEFVDDPMRCLKFIEERMATVIVQAKENQRLWEIAKDSNNPPTLRETDYDDPPTLR